MNLVRHVFITLATAASLAACAAPQRTVKIALVGPFEGRDRRIGYDAFPAFRIALRDHIGSDAASHLNVSFVAYNDDGQPDTAARVAESVAADPEVVAVIGHFAPDTTLRALGVYTRAGLAVLAMGPPASATPTGPLVFSPPPASSTSSDALRDFQAVSGGAPPGPGSVAAHAATTHVLAAIDADVKANGFPTRRGVAEQLRLRSK